MTPTFKYGKGPTSHCTWGDYTCVSIVHMSEGPDTVCHHHRALVADNMDLHYDVLQFSVTIAERDEYSDRLTVRGQNYAPPGGCRPRTPAGEGWD